MTINTFIIGNDSHKPAELYTKEKGVGQMVYTEPMLTSLLAGQFLINETFGSAMNQNVAFTGTPELIHNGGDATGWTGAAVLGTWDFAAAGVGVSGGAAVTVTSAINLSTATFNDAGEIDMSGYTAITGQVNLQIYSALNNSILLQFQNNGVNVGVPVSLNDYINTSLLGSYQSFVIPKSDLEIDNITVDELDIIITRSGGTRPTIYFDDIQIEEFGEPLIYTLKPRAGTKLHVNTLEFSWADVGTGITAFAYNKIGAISTLANGIGVNLTDSDVSGVVRNLGDFLSLTGRIVNKIDDGTNTFVTVAFDFKAQEVPIVLDSREARVITVTINDDLSGLLRFTCFSGCHEEDIT